MLIGYMRVSIAEQSLYLQRDALESAGCERVYQDIVNHYGVECAYLPAREAL
jgi:DNA invertase Pin-like site-specific DNA recombinase